MGDQRSTRTAAKNDGRSFDAPVESADATGSPWHYASDDRELLLGIYKRLLFRPALAILPRWVKPNAISVFGVLCAVSAVISAYLAVRGVSAFYIASGVLLYLYVIADNIDGPQARRTGQADELGELIDHSLDGITSGSILLTAGVILHMAAGWFFALASLGALAFIIVMYEQYRTGTLIIPRMSGTEGVTLVSGLCFFLYFAGEPAWLTFDVSTFNLAAGVLLFTLSMYILMMVPPVLRVRRAGHEIGELALPFAFVGACSMYVFVGADGLYPSIVVSVYGALVATRLILYRQTGASAPFSVLSDLLALLPVVPAIMLRHTWNPNVWASISAIVVTLLFLQTILSAAISFRRMARGQSASDELSAESSDPVLATLPEP